MTFRDQLDTDMDSVFLNTSEFADSIDITDLDGNVTTTKAYFEFQVGAVDEKERAIFVMKDSENIARGYFITYLTEIWTVIDIRPDGLGSFEVRCDQPEVTA